MENYTTTVENMSSIAENMPRAYEYPIFDGQGVPISNFKAVQTQYVKDNNAEKNTNNYLRVFTSKYNIVQHSFVIEEISSILNSMGLKGQVSIELKENGSRMAGYIFFDDKIIQDDSKGIKVGFKFTNSYDGYSGVGFSTYGIRLICLNQMTMSNLCAKELISHLGDKNFSERIKHAIKSVIDQDEKFQKIINMAMDKVYTFDEAKKIWDRMLEKDFGFRKTEKILSKINVSIIQVESKDKKVKKHEYILEDGHSLRKWDLYNAVTNFLSHEEKLSMSGKEWMEKISEKILSTY